MSRFMVTGLVALVAYYFAYITATELGVHYLISSVLGFFSYWLVHFFLNKLWTFKSRGNGYRQAGWHLFMHAGNHVLIMLGLILLIEYLGMHYILAQVLLNIIVAVEVYILSHLIFKH